MSLLPTSSGATNADVDPAVVDIQEEAADALFDALGSETARELYTALQDEPMPPSRLAESVGTSVQNVDYHLDRLEDAGVVEVVDTVYSDRGREMAVYGPTAEPLVILGDGRQSGLKAAITRFLGAVGLLAVVSIVLQAAVPTPAGSSVAPTGGSYGIAPAATAPQVGLLVFAAGLLVLACWAGLWHVRRR